MQHQSSTKIEATVFDPAPPPGLFAALGPALVVASVGLAFAGVSSGELLALGAALVLAYEIRPRRGPKKTRIACKPGSIRVPFRGLIRARDILGATTARVGDRSSLVLTHRRRRRTPMAIEVESDEALATICKSLGIGHHGFGQIRFITKPAGAERWRYPVATAAIISLVLTLVSVSGTGLLGFAFAMLLLLVAIVALVRVSTVPPMVQLTSAGVFVPVRGSTFLPFHMIEEVTLRPNELLFRVRTDEETIVHVVPIKTATWSRQSCSAPELEHFVAQIRAAVDRAHGKFIFKPEPTLTKRLERAENEPMADWLARIDMLGVGAAGYRTTAFDAAELWTLLEDPEANGDVRAAAARILARLDPKTLKVRVADVLATVRDDEVRTRIADTLEELEPSHEELGTRQSERGA